MYNDIFAEFSFWRLTSGIEADFIVNNMEVALEAKASERIGKKELKGLPNLKQDYPELKRAAVICLEAKYRKTEDGIEIIPAAKFAEMLWTGDFF
ncbi:MAG: hypothetical protein ACQES8_03760 [Thermodesulfobacteriota bacterium]